MSEQRTLNLGRFNQCVDYSSERKNRSIDPNANVFFCAMPISHELKDFEDKKVSELLSNGVFEIPTFVTSKFSDHGIDHLLSIVELDILSRIKETIEKSGFDAIFENIIVQIKSLQIFDDEKLEEKCPGRSGKYTIAEYGIAVVVPASELITT